MKTNKMFKSANTLHSGAKCAARLVSVLLPGSTGAWARTACAVLILAAGLTAGRAADYAITTNGNAIVVTDVSGNSDTFTVSESGAGFIRFAATPATRTFSVNGGAAITGDSGDLALAGVLSITVNTGAGDDTNDIGAFAGTLPSLTINGGTGDDSVNFNGDITFAANASLDVNLQNDAPTPGVDRVNVGINANLITSGSGAITLRCSRNIEVNSGARLETSNGGITLEANQQTTPAAGEFRGVAVLGGGARVTSTGAGIIAVRGRGGIGNSTVNFGIHLGAGGLVSSTGSGSILLDGRGGSGLANDWGVAIEDATTQVTSANANIVITGQGGGGGASGGNNLGVRLLRTSIAAGGSGTVTVQGTGGTGSSSGVNVNASKISSAGGNVQVTGQGGGTGASDSSHGVIVQTGSVVTNGGGGTVTVLGTGGAGSGDNQFGVLLQSVGTQITSGGGHVQVTGQGGGTGGSGSCYGVIIQGGGVVTNGGSGTVTVQGTGGAGSGENQSGVILQSAGSRITSAGGNVLVIGQGGGMGAAAFCYGVQVTAGAVLTNGGGGTVTVQGTAGSGSGGMHLGVAINGDGSTITSHGGNVQVTGIEGTGTQAAIQGDDATAITTAADGGTVTLIGNSMRFSSPFAISAQPGSSVTLKPLTAGVRINLGEVSDPTGGPLSLSDAELDLITAGTLVIGDTNSGPITVSAPISPAHASALSLVSSGTIADTASGTDVTVASLTTQGNLSPGTSPGIFSVVGNHTIAGGSKFTVEIGGGTPGQGSGFHDQLSASGSVTIGDNVTLSIVGFRGFVPVEGQSFAIVSRTGGSGTFAGLAEGATVSMNFLGSGMLAHISYVGGTGDDVVLVPVHLLPHVTCPADIGTNVPTGTATVVVNYAVPPAMGIPTPVVTCVPASGSAFPVGATLVTCVATNELGTNTCTFSVTVCVPTITVTSTNDSGPGTLRQAIADICPGGTITFAPALAGSTIGLTSRLSINKSISIVGLGADRLKVSGGGNGFTVFDAEVPEAVLNFSGLTISDGNHGILCRGKVLNIRGCVITNCTGVGAGLLFTSGTLTLVDSSIVGNHGSQSAAMHLQGCVASISNCTISANTGNGVGGVIFIISSQPLEGTSMMTLAHCTVSDNLSGNGAITTYSSGLAQSTVRLIDTLVSGNTTGGTNLNFVNLANGGGTSSVVSFGHNLDSDGTSGFINGANGDIVGTQVSLIDAKLGPLQNNGGPTPTRALLSGSPALNAGDPAFDTNSLAFDQRGPGFPRVVGGHTDIGAFEKQEVAPLIVCPAGIGTNVPSGTAAVVVNYAVPVTGNPTPVVTCVPASGNAFPVGATLVTCVATNELGTNTCTFSVTVCPIITVTSTNDSGPGSLRQAIADICPGGMITFAPALAGSTIGLTSQLSINKSISIVGLGADRLKVSGGGNGFPVFDVSVSEAVLNFSGLTISDGDHGIFCRANKVLNIRGCVITNCTGVFSGLFFSSGTLTVVDSSIVGNHGGQSAAMHLQGCVASISNCTISANTGNGMGGVIFILAAQGNLGTSMVTLAHCTVSDNLSGNGAITTYSSGLAQSTARLMDTLVSGNTTGGTNLNFVNLAFDGGTSSMVSLGHNLDSDGTSGFSNGANGDIVGTQVSPIDAMLGPLQNNGGPTPTRALLSGSPALNAGDPAFDINSLAFDQRGPGFPRVFGGRTDIGAFEYVEVAPRIVCPADIGTNILNATDTVVVPYAVPSATGIPTPVVTCVPASGSAFPVGTNLVTCVAANQVGTNTCAFTVTICVPTITVTSTNDSGPGSLRQAIADLCPGGTITFAPALAGSTIVLTTGQLFIDKGMSIVGLGADRLKVSGNLTTRAFEIKAPGAVVNLSALTISDGNAGSSFGGGLLSAYPATTLNIRGCAITNCAGIGAGVGFANGTLTIVDSSIVGNRSDDQAGALQLQGSIASISNCTISANTGRPSGAGIILNYAPTGSSTLTLAHCTVNENVGGGGGIWTTGSGATTRLVNTLVSGNTTDGANHNFFTTSGSSVVSLGHNLDSDGTSGFTNGVNGDIVGTLTSLVDAKLGPLANNGGPTVTRALLSGSPALNSGDNVSTNGLAYDQRGPGFPRLVGTAVDIGAFEVQDNGPACLVNWKFDEASGLTVLDSSGNNILGRLTNGPIRTNGVLGRAVRFDGSNDRVQATNSNSLNVTGAFTVACWVRPESVSDYQYFLIKGNDQDERFAYALRSYNAKVEYRWVNPAGVQSAFRTTTSVLAVGRWTHVAVAHAPGSAPTIFINGVAVTSSLRSDGGSATHLIGTSPNPFCVGASADGVDIFKGTIDEVFVCLSKLTAGQIRNLTNGLPPGPPPPPPAIGITSASPLPGGAMGTAYSAMLTATGGTPGFSWSLVSGVLPAGLTLNTNTGVISGTPTVAGTNTFRIRVLDTAAQASEKDFTLGIVTRPPCLVHWKFDEINGTTALDSSGNGINGTLLNGPNRTNGQVNGALRFDGSNDRVNGGNPSSLNYTGPLTLAAWVRPESVSGTRMVVIKGELNDDDFAWALGFTGGKLQYRWVNTGGNDSIYQSAAVVLASGRWTHIAGVHTPGSIPRLYTNGVLVAGSISTGSGTANIGTTSRSFTVGSSSDGADRFLGSIDEVFVCRSALNTTSVSNLMAGLPPDFNPAAPLPSPLSEPATGPTASPFVCTLRVFDGVATISWPSIPGLIYRVQFKNSLEEPEWQDLLGDIYPPGEATGVEDALDVATQRFYRVVLRP